MAFTSITVSTTWEPDAPGDVAPTGEAVFTLSEPMRQATGHRVESLSKAVPITAGAMSAELYANDDPATLPDDTFYSVQIRLNGYPVQPTFKIVVPHASATAKAKLSAIVAT